ncbi:nucleotidyltransferase domain-containing protein [Alkalicoccus daliensis]|uniref:Uncharacterized nucleotidyltransferase n=1 Tax=Alkalicoccus daliensis TaxID=745820 RepID=A0A1H0G0J7_9BACI|nr:nucleotidyltransferase family protein [Alkalicoccus daliensis]SDO00269.1 Uncharacterised nucleotidyltransferase [Alkalicoccus daliensis]
MKEWQTSGKLPEEMIGILRMLNREPVHWKKINIDNVMDFAGHHRLFPQLHRSTEHLEPPEQWKQSIQKHVMQHTLITLQLAGETARAADFFRTNNQRLLVLKGPALAQFLYGDVSARMSSDLDMLVPLEELENAALLLQQLGYKERPYFSKKLPDWKWRHHHLTFYHQDSGVHVELHWRMHPGPGREAGFEKLWKERRYVDFGQSNIPVMGTEHLFAFLAVHGARHGWSRLRWLCDMNELLKQDIHWAKLEEILGDQKLIAGTALALCQQLFHRQLPEETASWMQSEKVMKITENTMFYLSRKVELHAEVVPEYVSKYHRKYLFSLLSVRRKLLFVSSFLYPYPEDVAILKMPKSLYFLYIPIRPLLWIWRKTKKTAVTQ